MARPRGPPQSGARRMARSSVFRRKTLAQAEFTSAEQFKSFGAPAGRQPCGAVLPWSTWAIMATFLKCSFFMQSFFYGKAAKGSSVFHIRLNIIVRFFSLFNINSRVFSNFLSPGGSQFPLFAEVLPFSPKKPEPTPAFLALPPLTLLSRGHYNGTAATEAAPAPHVPRK